MKFNDNNFVTQLSSLVVSIFAGVLSGLLLAPSDQQSLFPIIILLAVASAFAVILSSFRSDNEEVAYWKKEYERLREHYLAAEQYWSEQYEELGDSLGQRDATSIYILMGLSLDYYHRSENYIQLLDKLDRDKDNDLINNISKLRTMTISLIRQLDDELSLLSAPFIIGNIQPPEFHQTLLRLRKEMASVEQLVSHIDGQIIKSSLDLNSIGNVLEDKRIESAQKRLMDRLSTNPPSSDSDNDEEPPIIQKEQN